MQVERRYNIIDGLPIDVYRANGRTAEVHHFPRGVYSVYLISGSGSGAGAYDLVVDNLPLLTAQLKAMEFLGCLP